MTDLSGLVVFRSASNGALAMGSPDDGPGPDDWSLDYLRARERAERAAAKRAQSIAARHIHQELAQHYAALLRRTG